MKNIFRKNIKIIMLGAMVLLTNGCEDVIEVDLNSSNPTIVIEGFVLNDTSKSIVLISKSTDFYKPGIYDKLSGASVLINDNKGNSSEFIEISEGVYESITILGETNVEYSIEVIAEGETYNANSTMPTKITLDSLSLEEGPTHPGKDGVGKNFFIHIYFQDQPNIEDYCRFKLYNNGALLSGFIIYDDRLTDGNYIDYKLLLDSDENKISLGDIITVELMSIDQAAFEFYKTANSINASGSGRNGPSSTSAAPSNPITNWNNNALGLFSAYAVSSESIELR